MLRQSLARFPALDEDDLVRVGDALVQIVEDAAVFLAGGGNHGLRRFQQSCVNFSGRTRKVAIT